jgi:hypothetical protein
MHGVYLVWWVQQRQISPAAVAAVLAAGDLAVTALEVPTGWLADRYGHRACLIAGSALQVAGMLYCWLGRGIPGLLVASVLVAAGDAFRSGADQALLYRSCVALDREPNFQAIEARTRAATLVALVVLLLGGGAIVRAWGFAAGWITETILSAIGLVIACAMTEPPAGVASASASTAGSVADDRPARSPSASNSIPPLAALIVPVSWLGAVAGAAAFFAQTSPWATTGRTTILVAMVTLAEAAGAMLARWLTAAGQSLLLLAALGTFMLAAAFVQPSILLPAIVGLSFLLGVAEPLRSSAIQRVTADSARARAASAASACDKAIATAALMVAGALPRAR